MTTSTTAPAPAMPQLPGVSHAFLRLSTGLRMHVAESGPLDAPAVLLLHGFPQSWWEWRKVIGPLAEHYRVIAPDLRGAGWTDAPAAGYTFRDQLDDVLALLDLLGLDRVRVVTHDFGAIIGLGLSFDHADRVAAHLLLAQHPYVRFRPHMLAALPHLWFMPVLATPGLGPWALRSDWLPRHLLRGFGGEAESFTDEDLAIFLSCLHTPGHPEAGSATYRELILPEMRRIGAGAYRSRHLTVPTVALVGGADHGVRPGDLDVDGDRADDLAGRVIEGAGHFVADDRPDAVVDHALALFGRVPA